MGAVVLLVVAVVAVVAIVVMVMVVVVVAVVVVVVAAVVVVWFRGNSLKSQKTNDNPMAFNEKRKGGLSSIIR